MVQVFLHVEEGVEEHVGHPAPLQVTEGYLTWRERTNTHSVLCEKRNQTGLTPRRHQRCSLTLALRFDQIQHLAE